MGEVDESSTSLKNFDKKPTPLLFSPKIFVSSTTTERHPKELLKVQPKSSLSVVKKKEKEEERKKEEESLSLFVKFKFVCLLSPTPPSPSPPPTPSSPPIKRYSNTAANTWLQRRIFARLSMATALNSRRSLPIA